MDELVAPSGPALTRAELDLLIQRIEARMNELGTNASETSKKSGLGSTAVNAIVTGKNKNPSLAVVKRIARALDCTVQYLMGTEASPNGPEIRERTGILIPITGMAEAGAFRVMLDFDATERTRDVPKIAWTPSVNYPTARHFALRVRGDSMNAAKPYPFVDGVVVVCVDFADAGLEVQDGKIYAVRRTRDAGQTYECTIKRARVFREHYEFRPESTNPDHQPLIIPRNAGRDDNVTQIDVIGLVYGLTLEGDLG